MPRRTNCLAAKEHFIVPIIRLKITSKHNMQILLANAKIMFGKADRQPTSTPLFQTVADTLAAEMARMDVDDLARQLDCSPKIAAENWKRYHNYVAAEKMPAILAYNGQAFKHLRANTLSDAALEYAQNTFGSPASSTVCFDL